MKLISIQLIKRQLDSLSNQEDSKPAKRVKVTTVATNRRRSTAKQTKAVKVKQDAWQLA